MLKAIREDLQKAGVTTSVNNCGETCLRFSVSLKEWTKHSTLDAGKLSKRDRFTIGVWERETIRTFSTSVQVCQANVQLALAAAQIQILLRSARTSETERKTLNAQIQGLEAKIQEHIELTKRQQIEAQQRKQQLATGSDNASKAERTLAIQEVKDRLLLIEEDQFNSGVVFTQVHSQRSGQEIKDVTASKDSEVFAGLPESVVGKINQRIGNVNVTDGSWAVVGVLPAGTTLNFGQRPRPGTQTAETTATGPQTAAP